MLTTKRKPATVGEILVEEFMQPMGLTQAALAEAMGVQRKHVNELCNNRRTVTAATALILARVFGNSPDFWLNVQRRSDLWEAMNSPASANGSNARRRSVPPVMFVAGKGKDIWGRNQPFYSPLRRNARHARRSQVCSELAEREGFEPPIRLPVCRISSAVHSTTLPPLRRTEDGSMVARVFSA
jgi:antitoxin HigA-1